MATPAYEKLVRANWKIDPEDGMRRLQLIEADGSELTGFYLPYMKNYIDIFPDVDPSYIREGALLKYCVTLSPARNQLRILENYDDEYFAIAQSSFFKDFPLSRADKGLLAGLASNRYATRLASFKIAIDKRRYAVIMRGMRSKDNQTRAWSHEAFDRIKANAFYGRVAIEEKLWVKYLPFP